VAADEHTPAPGARKPVSHADIFRFYLPLVLTSQMMTLSGPVINLGVGRSEDPTLNFAGYWLGFAVVLFLESPCLVVQQVAAALVGGFQSLRRLFLTSVLAGIVASLAILAVSSTAAGDVLFRTFIPTTDRVAELARRVMAIQAPIPILVCIRGVANGLAIRERRTPLVARATLVRIVILSTIVAAAVWLHNGSGAIAGAWALTTGIACEAATVVAGTFPFVRWRYRRRRTAEGELTYSLIFKVAAPLIVAGVVWTITRPVINAVVGLLPDPELAQAGFGVILPLILVTCSPLWTLQNVSLVLPETRADLRQVIRFSAAAALIFTVGILALALSPVSDLVLRRGFGLSPRLEADVRPAVYLIAIEPVLLTARAYSQGLLMKARRTEAFLVFSPIKIGLIAGAGFLAAHRFPEVSGTLLGTALFLGGDLLDAFVYNWKVRELLREGVLLRRSPNSIGDRSPGDARARGEIEVSREPEGVG
jgi:hypothetical protein